MKSCVLIGFLLCVALAISEAKMCKTGEECEADECCVKPVRFLPGQCKKMKQKDDRCIKDIEVNEDGVYTFACPCAEGLTCENVKEKNEDNIFDFLKERCV